MAKYGNSFYFEITRYLWKEPYKNMSINAKWLYATLKEVEHRFTNKEQNWFFVTDSELSELSGLSLSSVKRAKVKLKEIGLIKCGYMHWVDNKTGKKSEKKITSYTMIDL